MIALWPSVAEERWMHLRRRAKKWGVELDDRGAGPWRSNGPLLALLFFGLTLLVIGSSWALFKGVFTGVVAIAVAELLILRFRFFGTGVESALWIGGLLALISALPGHPGNEVILLFAAACAIAGLRVRNALFGALAMVLVIAYMAMRHWHVGAAAAGLVVSIAALLALMRTWQRPSTEMLMIALLIAPPIAGAIATAEKLPAWWALAYFVAACACLFAGLRLRHHAPLIAAAVHVIIAIVTAAVHEFMPWRVEWQLIVGGAILFAASALISRAIRGRTRGIVVTPDTLTPFDEGIQLAATLALQPKSETAPAEGPSGGGGRFGGAGSTGEY